MPVKPKRNPSNTTFTISCPIVLVEELNIWCEQLGVSRSTLLQELCRQALASKKTFKFKGNADSFSS